MSTKFILRSLSLLLFTSLLLSPFSAHAFTTNMNASVVVGQPNFTSNTINAGLGSVTARGFDYMYGVATNGTKMAVADYNNSRVLIYNSIPTSNYAAADVVVGQSSMSGNSTNAGGLSARSLEYPVGVDFAGNKLIIVDYNNSRVLVYNTIPTSNYAAADVVIGQSDFTTRNNATSRTRMSAPEGVDYDEQTNTLVINDYGNARVLLYRGIPTTNGAAADVVVGQPDFTSSSIANPPTAASLNSSYSARIFNGKLVIADTYNHRILIYNSIPTTNGASADVVLGQPNFTSKTANQGGSVSARTLNTPTDIAFDGKRLYVYDSNNSRVLIYDGIPTVNNAPAALVIGQQNLTSNSANQGGSVRANTLNANDTYMYVYNDKLFVADSSNYRVLIFNNVTSALSEPSVISGANAITLAWNTSAPSAEYVEYGTSTSLFGMGFGSLYRTGDQRSTGHSVTIAGLSPCTRYYFRATSIGYDLQDAVSPIFTGSTGGTCSGFTNSWVTSLGTPVEFKIVTPNNIYTTDTRPAFKFTEATDTQYGIARYQVMVKGPEGGWKTYIDNIRPTDRRDTDGSLKEDEDKVTKYDVPSRAIEVVRRVRPGENPSESELITGAYRYKIRAVNGIGATKDTEERVLRINTYQAVMSENGTPFPLTLSQIGERTTLSLGSHNPSVSSQYTLMKPLTIARRTPTFYGIANVGASVTLKLSRIKSDGTTEDTSFNTTANDSSRYGINISPALKAGIYTVELSASNDRGDYVEIPSFSLKIK